MNDKVLRLIAVYARETPGILLLCVLTGSWTLTREDITFDDEASYMLGALGLDDRGFSDGPLYSYAYRIVGVAASDPVSMYLLGRVAVACSFVIAVWLAARLITRRSVAWVVAAVASAIPVSHVWPGVATPAAALLIVGAALLWRFPHSSTVAIVSVFTWLAAGMRPEFVWMAILVTCWSLVVTVRQAHASGWHPRASILRTALLMGTALVVPTILIYRFGSPLGGSSRSWVAFSQHFAQRRFTDGENPWYDHVKITERFFGSADSVFDAARENPAAFLGHVWANAVETPRTLARFAWGSSPPLDTAETIAQALVTALVLASIWSGIRALRTRLMGQANPLRAWTQGPRWALGFTALWMGTVAISVILISPRQHYLVSVIAVLLLGAAYAVDRWAGRLVRGVALPSTVVALITCLSAVTLAGMGGLLASTKEYASAARELQSIAAPMNYLAGLWGLHVYARGLVPVQVAGDNDYANFKEFLLAKDVDVVLVNDTLWEGPWSRLPGYEDFVADPSSFGFSPLGPRSQLWIRDQSHERSSTS